MDQAENSRDDPHGLTDLDLGGQPRPAHENDFNPGAHFGAWGGEGVPTASLADVVPPLPNDSFGAGNQFKNGKNVPQQQSDRDPREIQGHSRQNILPPNPPRAWTQFPDGGTSPEEKEENPVCLLSGQPPFVALQLVSRSVSCGETQNCP